MRERLVTSYSRVVSLLRRTPLARSKRLVEAHRRLRVNIDPDVIDVQGHWMYLDPVDSLALRAMRVWEPFETHVASVLVRPGTTVVDAGAHIGYYTLLFARLVGPSGRVIAFEPDPSNHHLLERNVALNGYRNVEIHNTALADRTGRAQLFRSETNLGDHRLFQSDPGRTAVEVDVTTLDDRIGSRVPIDFIKLDLQASEPLALKGMGRVIDGSPEIAMIVEYWPYGLAQAGHDPLGALHELDPLVVLHIDEELEVVEPARGDALLERFPPNDEERHTNLLCVRDEKRLDALRDSLGASWHVPAA